MHSVKLINKVAPYCPQIATFRSIFLSLRVFDQHGQIKMLNGQHCGTVAVGNRTLGLLSEFDKDLLGRYLQEIALPAGSVLCERGGKEEYVYFPHRGAVSMIAAMADGSAVEIAAIGRDGVVGSLSALGLPQAFAKTVVSVELGAVQIATRRLHEILPKTGTLGAALSADAGRLMFQAQQVSGCNALHPIEQRLARLLLRAADCLGGNRIPFTQELMSQMLGVQRTTVNLVIRMMATAGAVNNRRGWVEIVDRLRLEAKACECYACVRDQTKGTTLPFEHAWQSVAQGSVGEILF